jgi:hypothetical protein
MAKICLLLATMAVSVVVGLTFASPAQAHEGCGLHGDDVVCNRYTSCGVTHKCNWIDGCDREPDGHYVRAHYWLAGFETYNHGDWDDNGSASGCAHNQTYQFKVWQMRICEEVVGCSNWLWHDSQ